MALSVVWMSVRSARSSPSSLSEWIFLPLTQKHDNDEKLLKIMFEFARERTSLALKMEPILYVYAHRRGKEFNEKNIYTANLGCRREKTRRSGKMKTFHADTTFSSVRFVLPLLSVAVVKVRGKLCSLCLRIYVYKAIHWHARVSSFLPTIRIFPHRKSQYGAARRERRRTHLKERKEKHKTSPFLKISI